jgi:hypothetical protein
VPATVAIRPPDTVGPMLRQCSAGPGLGEALGAALGTAVDDGLGAALDLGLGAALDDGLGAGDASARERPASCADAPAPRATSSEPSASENTNGRITRRTGIVRSYVVNVPLSLSTRPRSPSTPP